MATDAYLKAAAGQLLQGAEALKSEATRIRSEAAMRRQQLEREIVSKQTAMKGEQLRSVSLGSNPQSSALQLDIRRLQNEVDGLKRELDQVNSESEQHARSKESAMQALSGQAHNLQQMSADPRLR